MDADGFVTPTDAIIVINSLNRSLASPEPDFGSLGAFGSGISHVGNGTVPNSVSVQSRSRSSLPTPSSEPQDVAPSLAQMAVEWLNPQSDHEEDEELSALDAVFASFMPE